MRGQQDTAHPATPHPLGTAVPPPPAAGQMSRDTVNWKHKIPRWCLNLGARLQHYPVQWASQEDTSIPPPSPKKQAKATMSLSWSRDASALLYLILKCPGCCEGGEYALQEKPKYLICGWARSGTGVWKPDLVFWDTGSFVFDGFRSASEKQVPFPCFYSVQTWAWSQTGWSCSIFSSHWAARAASFLLMFFHLQREAPSTCQEPVTDVLWGSFTLMCLVHKQPCN